MADSTVGQKAKLSAALTAGSTADWSGLTVDWTAEHSVALSVALSVES